MSETVDDKTTDEQTTNNREYAAEGEILDEIPSNWKGVAPFQDAGDLYLILESNTCVEIESRGTHLDHEHEVLRVGDLDSGIAHDLDHDDLKDFIAETRELHEEDDLRFSDDEAEDILEALTLLDEHWDYFVDEHERVFTDSSIDYLIDIYETERVRQYTGYETQRGFVPDSDYPMETDLEMILRDLGRKDLLDVTDDLTFILQEGDVLPYDPELRLSVESDTEKNLLGLLEAGCSPAAAVDYVHTVVEDRTQAEWADFRGVDQSTVYENIANARDTLQN